MHAREFGRTSVQPSFSLWACSLKKLAGKGGGLRKSPEL